MTTVQEQPNEEISPLPKPFYIQELEQEIQALSSEEVIKVAKFVNSLKNGRNHKL